jgi:hypothetical protein
VCTGFEAPRLKSLAVASLAKLTENNYLGTTRGNECGPGRHQFAPFFKIGGCAPSEPRIQSKLGDGVTQLCPRGPILSFMPRSLSKNALYHARADTKLPADLENAVATSLQFYLVSFTHLPHNVFSLSIK